MVRLNLSVYPNSPGVFLCDAGNVKVPWSLCACPKAGSLVVLFSVQEKGVALASVTSVKKRRLVQFLYTTFLRTFGVIW